MFYLSALSALLVTLIQHFLFNNPQSVPSFLFTTLFVYVSTWLIFFARRLWTQRKNEQVATGQHSADWNATCASCFSVYPELRNWTRCPQCGAMLVPSFVAPENGYEFTSGGRPRGGRP